MRREREAREAAGAEKQRRWELQQGWDGEAFASGEPEEREQQRQQQDGQADSVGAASSDLEVTDGVEAAAAAIEQLAADAVGMATAAAAAAREAAAADAPEPLPPQPVPAHRPAKRGKVKLAKEQKVCKNCGESRVLVRFGESSWRGGVADSLSQAPGTTVLAAVSGCTLCVQLGPLGSRAVG